MKLIAVAVFTLAQPVAAQQQIEPNLKKIADYAVAESGAPIRPAWSAVDETASTRAQTASASVISEAANRDREGAMALRRACGLAVEGRDLAVKRALNRNDYASALRMKLKPNPMTADDATLQRVTVIGLNRLDAYASGYESGAFESYALIFKLEPKVRAELCRIVGDRTR